MENNFKVYTIQSVKEDTLYLKHWSKGLTMVIKKDGQSIILNEEEIKELVKSLPKTIGGKY